MRISDWSSDVCSSDLTTSTTWSSLPPLAGPVTGTKVGSSAMGVTIDEILVGDPREAWEAAGFTVDPDGTCRIGTVKVRLVGRDGGKRILGWSLRGAESARLADGSLDGLPDRKSTRLKSSH